MSTPFSHEDLILHQEISETDAAWDANLVACAVSTPDPDNDSTTSKLWLFPLDGSAPSPLTTGDSTDTMPRWRPDGEALGFVSDRAGAAQIFVLPRHGGEATQLSHLSGTVSAFEWSPDGTHVAAVCAISVDPRLRGERTPADAELPGPDAPQVAWKLPYKSDGIGYLLNVEMHLYIIDAASGEARRMTDGPFDVRSASWSPDGQQIVFVRTREGDEAHRTDVWVCDVESGDARCLTALSQVLYPTWSPDGKWIVFSGTAEDGDAQVGLWIIDVASGDVRPLGDPDIELSTESDSVQFLRGDASRVLALVARRGVVELVSVSVPEGQVTPLVQGERHLSKVTVTRDHLAYTAHSPVAAVELYKCSYDGSGESVVSALNTWWQDRTLPHFERRTFTVPDGEGGTETIDGWFLRPADATGPTPLLVDVHGGPASYVLFDYNPTAYWSLLWSQGWSILALNAVGSASFGRAFADRLRGHWGELDLPQHLAAIRTLQDEGLADDRLMLAGKSYGGYLTSWAIGDTDLFQAAVVMAPVTNIETHYGTSDSGFYSDPYAMRGDRRHHRETMRRLSPMQHVEHASTPTLILQGTDDERCPKCQAEELFVTLRRDAACAAELVLYPGASHKFTASGKLSHRKDVMSRIASWAMQWVIEGDPQRPGDEQRTGEQRMKNTAET
ncbi:hypothetical protein GCM10007242_06160 [Pigmentiphaga litoralis]|uniref:S9 family peptidase n=1 Tax=Pigmentiphaga litoralis TaxID=516702 RepID=UPI00167C03A3|nr:S9 family peptidase [Pigmentiphaga litoralis]GGX03833.1 hypothetical protein GCM10007242_06160 [Pigmentiphaga litoralis]